MKKRFIACLLLFSILGSGTLYADKVDDLRKEKKTQQENIEKKKKNIDQMTTEKDQLFNKIVQKKKLIEELDAQLTELEDLITQLSEEIQASNNKIEELQKRIEKNEELFKKRIRVMYGNKNLNSIEILFSSSDIRDFISRYFMMQSIADYDKKLITTLKNDKNSLVKEKEILESKKAEKVDAKKQMEIKLQRYHEEVARNEELITELESTISYTESEIGDLERKIRKLDANISFEEKVKAEILRQMAEKKLQESISSGEVKNIPSTGEMAWPLQGYYRVSSPFGWRSNPFGRGGTQRHTGIDIPAPMGTPVYSATEGTVIRAGWYGGYGNAVVVQYTNNITIIYGHNSKLIASVGQRVSKGQVISLVGSTGYSTGAHLHFEVRVKGAPVNPIPYLRS